MSGEQSLILLNLLVCSAGGLMCICRMAHMDSNTKQAIRAQYTIWFSMFAASGWSFTYEEPSSFIQLLMGAALVAHMLIGMGAWRHGAPNYTVRT